MTTLEMTRAGTNMVTLTKGMPWSKAKPMEIEYLLNLQEALIMNVERTLFWFKDKDETLVEFNNEFFGLATLLNRLLNEVYDGKKIKFINLDFATNKVYELYPVLPKLKSYYYNGHLRFYGVFDREQFIKLSKIEQCEFVWEKSHEYLVECAIALKNTKLKEAVDYAYSNGIEQDLNPDSKVVNVDLSINEKPVKAAIWIHFGDDGMHSILTLEASGKMVFKKELDKARKGIEFFLEVYKTINFENNEIVIKGRSDAEGLPMKIPLALTGL